MNSNNGIFSMFNSNTTLNNPFPNFQGNSNFLFPANSNSTQTNIPQFFSEESNLQHAIQSDSFPTQSQFSFSSNTFPSNTLNNVNFETNYTPHTSSNFTYLISFETTSSICQSFQQQTTTCSITANLGELFNSSDLYTKFEDLPNYPQDADMKIIMDQIRRNFDSKQDWKSVFDAIDNLRILNKYYPQEINEIVGVYWDAIVDCLDSQKPPIIKNILLFLKEMFKSSSYIRLHDGIISNLIPLILNKVLSEKAFIKREVEKIVDLFVTNCCFDSSIQTLCRVVDEKKGQVQEYAMDILIKMVYNIGTNLPQLQTASLKALMLTLANTMNSAKNGTLKTKAANLCKGFKDIFGFANYYNLVKLAMEDESPHLIDLLFQAVRAKREDDRRKSRMLEFISKQKSNLKKRDSGKLSIESPDLFSNNNY